MIQQVEQLNTQNLSKDKIKITSLLYSTGTTKTVPTMAQNQTIVMSYTDNVDGNMPYTHKQ